MGTRSTRWGIVAIGVGAILSAFGPADHGIQLGDVTHARPLQEGVQSGSEAALIMPGTSVGPIRLGEDTASLRLLIPLEDTGVFHYYPGAGGCGRSIDEIDWPPHRSPGNATVAIFLTGGQVFQIESRSPLYHTKSGLTVRDSPADVKRQFQGLEAYVRLNEHDPATGDRDFIYWISRAMGIAFTFAYYGPKEGRRLYAVDVFRPGADFRPSGCVEPPQVWRRLAPYTIEVPGEQTRLPGGGTFASYMKKDVSPLLE